MAFFYDRSLYRAIDPDRELTFNVTGLGKEQEGRMTLSHRDGSGVEAAAYAGTFSPAFCDKINQQRAAYAETWIFAMPMSGIYRIGGVNYTPSALTALLQEAADAFAYRSIPNDKGVALAEVMAEY